MKTIASIFLTFALITSAAFASNPNIILIFTDDQGYRDLGCFGSETIKTPNIDRLAKEGCKLTQFFTASSICSPSRAALLTGSYPKRLNMHKGVIFPRDTKGMHPNEITIAEILKEVGYSTGMVGKWHLGNMPELLPTSQGFDSWVGCPYSNDMAIGKYTPLAENVILNNNFTRDNLFNNTNKVQRDMRDGVLMENLEVIEYPFSHDEWTHRYTKEAVAFIRKNKDRPFFLYLAHSMPHIPVGASEHFKGKSAYGPYGDTIEEIDWGTGQIMKELKALNLDKNTVIIYTSDNGPWLQRGVKKGTRGTVGTALPLRNAKMTVWDGGNRVPTVIWGPKHLIKPRVINDMASTIDLMPTIANWTGATLPNDRVIDGLDLSGFLLNQEPTPRNSLLYYSAFQDQLIGFRYGDWKLLVHSKDTLKTSKKTDQEEVELFNIKDDISESINLAKLNPEKVDELKTMMRKLDDEIVNNQRMAAK